ncbi:FixJ family two-component response regulator [Brevundimonas vesicularis]|uniref:FixJ family two-component response regulator n=2 Tax=Brevundimonas vesicularis TaxID=41276 RepID=A0A7W9FRL4_BREVE|nr:FixJ family two-component response regulator [Brevundimonas vesicularis]
MFFGAGYAVNCFESAEQFLGAGAPNPSSLIISDLQMGGISGLELIRTLRGRGDATPVILLTAFATPAIRTFAARSGVSRIFEKPFKTSELLEIVLEIVG